MVAEERRDHHPLVGLEALLKRAPERCGCPARRPDQRRESQRGRALEIARHQKATRRHRREACGARRRKIAGEPRGERPGVALVEVDRGIRGVEQAEPTFGLRQASRGAGGGDRRARPVPEGLVHQRQVEQPLARIVDDVEVDGVRPGQSADQSLRRHPERQAQGGDRAGALGPVRVRAGQGVEMILVGEPRDGVVGLWLQVRREDAPFGLGAQLRHPPAVDQVGDQRGDEHGLAGAAEPRHPEPDHRVADHPADIGHRVLDAVGEAAGQTVEIQSAASSLACPRSSRSWRWLQRRLAIRPFALHAPDPGRPGDGLLGRNDCDVRNRPAAAAACAWHPPTAALGAAGPCHAMP